MAPCNTSVSSAIWLGSCTLATESVSPLAIMELPTLDLLSIHTPPLRNAVLRGIILVYSELVGALGNSF